MEFCGGRRAYVLPANVKLLLETPEEVKALLHEYLENFKWLYEARTGYATHIDKDCFITWQIEQDEQGKLTADQVGLFWVWLLGVAGVLEPAGFQVDIR